MFWSAKNAFLRGRATFTIYTRKMGEEVRGFEVWARFFMANFIYFLVFQMDRNKNYWYDFKLISGFRYVFYKGFSYFNSYFFS